jgi:S1-C subfamily serine protease
MKSLIFFILALGATHPIVACAQDKFGITPNKSIIYIESREIKDDDANDFRVLSGTGFVVSMEGYVLTAAHVIHRRREGYIYTLSASLGSRANSRYPLETIEVDYSQDLAVLMLPPNLEVAVSPLTRGKSTGAKIGDHLYAYGFPSGLDLSLAEGSLSSKAVTKGQWQTTIGLNPGQSGGPVLNDRGEWVAVAVAGNESKNQVSYAVPEIRSTNILQLIAANSELRPPASQNKLPFVTDQFKLQIARAASGDSKPQRHCVPAAYTVNAAVSDRPNWSDSGSNPVRLVKVDGVPNCIDAYVLKLPGGKIPVNDITVEIMGAKSDFKGVGMVMDNDLKKDSGIQL